MSSFVYSIIKVNMGNRSKAAEPIEDSFVFFDIVIGEEQVGRIYMQLYGNTPITSSNFHALCIGY